MRVALGALAAAVATSAAGAARADDTPWGISASTAYVYIGHKERPTGGMMITASATRSWMMWEGAECGGGAELSSFGFDSGGRWAAIIGGVVGYGRFRPSQLPVWMTVGVHLDAGRLPTCTKWGLCLLYSGVFPALSVGPKYAPSDRVSYEFVVRSRLIRTLAFSGPDVEGAFNATIRF